MLSIYKKDVVEKLCKEYCEGVEENGKIILKGMIVWVENRVNKYCASKKKDVKNLRSKLTESKIREILETKPEKLINIWEDFECYANLKNLKNDKITILENIFDYDSFRGFKSSIVNGFWLSKELGVDCCPYCNRNFTTSHKQNYDLNKNENKYVFPCFDHFYPKEVYPLLALSFYNLIPSCNVCNSDYKGIKDPNDLANDKYKILHPYNDLGNKHFSFDFIPEKYEDLVGKGKNIDLTINYKNLSIKSDLEKSINFFGILENYKNHQNLIRDIIDKKITFSDEYLANIQATYNLDFHTTYKILFETHYEDDKLFKLPFSKLKKDIYDKLESIRRKSKFVQVK